MVSATTHHRGRSTAILAALVLLLTTMAFAVGVHAAESNVPAVFIATGDNFPDGLVAGAAAGVNSGPVLLTRKDSLPAVTIAELQRLHPDRIYIAGGTGVISAAVESRLAAYGPVTRLAGSDRYATAAAISNAVFPVAITSAPTLEFYTVHAPRVSFEDEMASANPSCHSGDVAVSGSITKIDAGPTVDYYIVNNRQSADGESWEFYGHGHGKGAIDTFVLCAHGAKFTP